MLLSVLIPVYRQHPEALLQALLTQIAHTALAAEVLVLDDSADAAAFTWHETYATHPEVRIFSFPENLGRSAARNRLLDEAQGDFLLFLDGDMQLPADFLDKLLPHLKDNQLVCGGIASKADANNGLRARYSRNVEEKSASLRNQHPYRSFTAANFAMPAAWKTEHRFPEPHEGYGHEDTHFGLQLQASGRKIQHIDCPALHTGFDSDAVFVDKSREAVKNLVRLYHRDPLFRQYSDEIRLIRSWRVAQATGLLFFLTPFLAWMEGYLKAGKGSLKLFSLYKLALFEFYFRRKTSL
ncbi:MAG: glycosyltransferase family 2 protein [Sphingobacteriaceae bacterium]|nr:glycosyltransferase family 2 protein [Sphingobacteriaceae bacterium]